MADPVVQIKPRLDLHPGATVTDILIEHDGRHYGSRVNILMADNEVNRGAERLAFLLRRRKADG